MEKYVVMTNGYHIYYGIGETPYHALSSFAQVGGLSHNDDTKAVLYEVHEKSRVDLGQILTPKGEDPPIKLCEFTIPVKIVRAYLNALENIESVMDVARFS